MTRERDNLHERSSHSHAGIVQVRRSTQEAAASSSRERPAGNALDGGRRTNQWLRARGAPATNLCPGRLVGWPGRFLSLSLRPGRDEARRGAASRCCKGPFPRRPLVRSLTSPSSNCGKPTTNTRQLNGPGRKAARAGFASPGPGTNDERAGPGRRSGELSRRAHHDDGEEHDHRTGRAQGTNARLALDATADTGRASRSHWYIQCIHACYPYLLRHTQKAV